MSCVEREEGGVKGSSSRTQVPTVCRDLSSGPDPAHRALPPQGRALTASAWNLPGPLSGRRKGRCPYKSAGNESLVLLDDPHGILFILAESGQCHP